MPKGAYIPVGSVEPPNDLRLGPDAILAVVYHPGGLQVG